MGGHVVARACWALHALLNSPSAAGSEVSTHHAPRLLRLPCPPRPACTLTPPALPHTPSLPPPQRKRLEPFEVPKSGAFWLHDDRFEAGEEEGGGGMRSEQVEAEQDERQK